MKRKTYQWVEVFPNGRTSVVDEGRLGRPTTSRTDVNVERVNAVVPEGRRTSITYIDDKLDFSCGSAHSSSSKRT